MQVFYALDLFSSIFNLEAEAAESMKSNALLQPPNTELDKLDRMQARRCYFGTFDLEIGAVTLSGWFFLSSF